MADERSCAQSGTLLAVSSDGVVASAVRAREQGRADQNRFLRGIDDALPGAGYRKPRGMSLSSLPVVGAGESRRVVRVVTPTVSARRCDGSQWNSAALPRSARIQKQKLCRKV